ncbi:MAG: AI-2E family transporter, partial [Clostridia bacterium]|nr:AI-2E family transporter [Clostridia bacterium]
MIKFDWRTCGRIAATIFGLYLCIHYWTGFIELLKALFGAASPVIIGLASAYIINILMSFYEKHYFPKSSKKFVIKSRRAVSMILAIVSLLGAISLVVGLVIPELISCIKFLIAEIPPAIEKLISSEFIERHVPAEVLAELESINWKDYISQVSNVVVTGIGDAVDIIFTTVTSIFSGLVTAFISVIFTIYLLVDRDKLKGQAKRLMKCYLSQKVNDRILYTLKIFNKCFHRYIVGQCTEAVILGLLCTIGMLIFRFPYAGMVGALIGFTALIPIAGAYIGAGIGAVMILTESPLKALLFLVFILCLQQFEGNVIYPKVVGKSLGLPGLWVLAAVTVGGGLFGIIGMLIGVPITAAVYRIIKEDIRRKNPECLCEDV